ncbi:S1 domain-containing RNA-binding protein [Cohnella candidum]|uniref:RNA-binding protein S1 n=1 Tax=Cohnella candidum TaxID=2674991 RepID=A0A3G3K274_9BACL|nr:S1 domain-containing RNA-binding protein [Cohnella candidum]AYQ74624.1 RNA-binding protein S1 [Cohnella candidum]
MAIEVGTKMEGKVTGITHFGAFVDLSGGVTGLVHISEVADSYVKDIHEHLKVNDVVTVKVINVDQNGKIGLSIRQAVDKPPEQQQQSYPRGPRGGGDRGGRPFKGGGGGGRASFDDKLSRFLKDSEERISSLKKSTESKRGGRGGRRS